MLPELKVVEGSQVDPSIQTVVNSIVLAQETESSELCAKSSDYNNTSNVVSFLKGMLVGIGGILELSGAPRDDAYMLQLRSRIFAYDNEIGPGKTFQPNMEIPT